MNKAQLHRKARKLLTYGENTIGLDSDHPLMERLSLDVPVIAAQPPLNEKPWFKARAKAQDHMTTEQADELLTVLDLPSKPVQTRRATYQEPTINNAGAMTFRIREELQKAVVNNRPGIFLTFTFADDWLKHAKEITTGKHRSRLSRQLHLIHPAGRWTTRTEWGSENQRPHIHAIWTCLEEPKEKWPWNKRPAHTHASLRSAGSQHDEALTLPYALDWYADDGLPVWPYGQIQAKPIRFGHNDYWATKGHAWPSNDEPLSSNPQRIAMYTAKDLTKSGITPEGRPDDWKPRTNYSNRAYGIDHRLIPFVQEAPFDELLAIVRNFAIPKGQTADDTLLTSIPPRDLLQRIAWKEIYNRDLTRDQEAKAIGVARYKALDTFGIHLRELINEELTEPERIDQLANMALYMLGLSDPVDREKALAHSHEYNEKTTSPTLEHATTITIELCNRAPNFQHLNKWSVIKRVSGAIQAHAYNSPEFYQHMKDADAVLKRLEGWFPQLEFGGPTGYGVAGSIEQQHQITKPPKIKKRKDVYTLAQKTFEHTKNNNQQPKPRNKKWTR